LDESLETFFVSSDNVLIFLCGLQSCNCTKL
jgi:hypothetical protein